MRTALPSMNPTSLNDVSVFLEKKIELAEIMGLTLDGRAILRVVRADCFRVDFGNDPPVRAAPMQVHLKAGARPVRAQPRRYSPTDRAFLDRHTAALIAHAFSSSPTLMPKLVTVGMLSYSNIAQRSSRKFHLAAASTSKNGTSVNELLCVDHARGYM
jgi:hypothetical protein